MLRAPKRGKGETSLASQTYFARAEKRGGKNTSGVFGQVFVCSRKVIPHVILLHEIVLSYDHMNI